MTKRVGAGAAAVLLGWVVILGGEASQPIRQTTGDTKGVCEPKNGAQPVIDAHLHAITASSVRRARTNTQPIDIDIGVTLPDTDAQVLQQTLSALDQNNVVLAILSGLPAAMDRWIEAAPHRFIRSIGFDDATEDIAVLRAQITGGRLRVMGELGFQYAGLAPNDPSLEPYFALAEELDVPMGIHLYGGGAAGRSEKFRVALGNPLLLEDVLVRHPKLRLYVMHAGLPFLEGTIALLRRYREVYADLSQINYSYPRAQFHTYLEGLMQADLGKRLMYGSDPTRGPHTISAGLEAINSAQFLDAAQKADILCANAARFFRIQALPGR